jgi:hypothetical protein
VFGAVSNMSSMLIGSHANGAEERSGLGGSKLLPLRNYILREITGRLSEPCQRSALSQLTRRDNFELSWIIRNQLLRYPQDLGESLASCFHNMPFLKIRPQSQPEGPALPYGQSSIVANCSSPGRETIWARKRRNWWHFGRAASAQLHIFLFIVGEAAFKNTTGAGGFAISPRLMFYGTVRRSESPIFQPFDKFAPSCAEMIWYTDDPTRYSELATRNGQFECGQGSILDDDQRAVAFDWNPEKVKIYLSELQTHLLNQFSSVKCSGTDKDEFGHSLYHASDSALECDG